MSILYNQTATLSRKWRNANMVTARSEIWSFPCCVQPVSDKDWIEWASMMRTKKMYTDFQNIQPWDKLSIDWVVYIVDSVQDWNWLRRKYKKVFINESNGS